MIFFFKDYRFIIRILYNKYTIFVSFRGIFIMGERLKKLLKNLVEKS